MKRTLAFFSWLIFLVGIGLGQPSYAQQETGSAVDDGADQVGETAAPDAEPRDEVEEAEPTPPPPKHARFFDRRAVARLGKLRDAMMEKLDLSAQQRKAIEELFGTQTRKLKERAGGRGAELDEIKALQKQMKDARKAGDVETAKNIRKQIAEKARPRRRGTGGGLSQFLEKVEGQLEKEQVETFRTLVKRFRLDDARHPRGGPLRNLMRAVHDPSVGLSEDQRRAVREIIRRSILDIPPGERGGDRMERSAEAVRGKIFELLTAEQRTRLEAALKSPRRARRAKETRSGAPEGDQPAQAQQPTAEEAGEYDPPEDEQE